MITNSRKVPENEVQVPNYRWKDGLVVLMDCGGSTAVEVNRQLKEANSNYGGVKLIGTGRKLDHSESKARIRADEFEVDIVNLDFRGLEETQGIIKGAYLRAINTKPDERTSKMKSAIEFRDDLTKKFIGGLFEKMDANNIPRNTPVIATGFMQLLSEYGTKAFDIVNNHPGDPTKYELRGIYRGKRIVVGDAWVPSARAISAGHESLYSSTFQLISEMDAGMIFMRGYELPIDHNFLLSNFDLKRKDVLRMIGEEAQNTLKFIGDHVIAGATFQDLFDGNWGLHVPSKVQAYRFNGEWYLAPNGIMIQDHVANHQRSVFERTPDFIDGKVNEFYARIIERRSELQTHFNLNNS